MNYFKNNLRVLRFAKNQTQKQVAAMLDVKERTYQAYEEGRAQPNNQLLITIANLQGVTIHDLVLNDLSKMEPAELKGNLVQMKYNLADLETRNEVDHVLKIEG